MLREAKLVSILPELLLWQQTKPLIDGDGRKPAMGKFSHGRFTQDAVASSHVGGRCVEFMSPTFGSLRDEVV